MRVVSPRMRTVVGVVLLVLVACGSASASDPVDRAPAAGASKLKRLMSDTTVTGVTPVSEPAVTVVADAAGVPLAPTSASALEVVFSLFLRFVRFLLYLVAASVLCLWWFQGSLLYMPGFGRAAEASQTTRNTKGFRSPAEYGLPYEEAHITAADGVVLHAWLVTQSRPSAAPTIVFFHGNAGNIGYRLPNVKALYHTSQCNVLLVDYRGYGNSAGEPSEIGLRLDAQAALHYLRKGRAALADGVTRPPLDLARIYLFGRSLGGAVALATAFDDQQSLDADRRLAADPASVPPPIAGLLLENTFCALVEMVFVLASRLGMISPSSPPDSEGGIGEPMRYSGPHARAIRAGLRWLMTSRWESLSVVSHLRTPMLFLSGLSDELIPPSHMAGLFEAAGSAAERRLFVVPAGTHNDTHVRGGMEYFDAIAQFMEETRPDTSISSPRAQHAAHAEVSA